MSQVCQAKYSNVPVWVLAVNGVSVMRRQGDGWVNATHLLKVANFDKPRRTRILERDVQSGEHEKVQGGYGKYQGTWVPVERAIVLAREFGVHDGVRDLLEYVEKSDGTVLPQAARATARRNPTLKPLPMKRARKSATVPDIEPMRRTPAAKSQSFKGARMPSTQTVTGEGSASSSPLSSTSGFFSDEETGGSRLRWDPAGSPVGRFQGTVAGDPEKGPSSYMNKYSATLLDFFMAPNNNKIPDILLHPQPGFHINQVIDDEGHTVFHWACAMGQVKVMEALLDAGADPNALNYAGHTPLVRAVHFTNNYDLRTLPHVLELLKESLFHVDAQGATVLHHVAFTAASKSKAPSSRYYMELVLAKMTELSGIEYVQRFISQQDTNQDTALHVSSRNGSRKLVKMLLSYNASADIPNRSGRTAHEYICEYETQRRQSQILASSSSPPSIYMRRSGPMGPFARHQPTPHVSEAGILATQQVAGRMSDYLEELAQAYDADLKDRDTDIEQVRQLLFQVKRRTSDARKQIPELQAKLGPDEQVNREIQQVTDLVRTRSVQLHKLVERTQARDLALLVQKEEDSVQDILKQQLGNREYDHDQIIGAAQELCRLQAERQRLVAEIVDLYANAGSGERMNDYRKLVSLSCGADVSEIDGLLDGIAQALEDRQ